MINKGLMLVVSGPAGSGKGTVNGMLMKREDFAFSVSATTRQPRPGEIDGVNYHYVSREEFLARIESGDMLEYTEYCGNFYGTPLKEAKDVKAKYPDAVLVLLLPPTYSEQEARLRGRATETEEKILERLARAKEEVALADCYDYVVYNFDGKPDQAAAQILSIVEAEKLSIKRNRDVAKNYLNA